MIEYSKINCGSQPREKVYILKIVRTETDMAQFDWL